MGRRPAGEGRGGVGGGGGRERVIVRGTNTAAALCRRPQRRGPEAALTMVVLWLLLFSTFIFFYSLLIINIFINVIINTNTIFYIILLLPLCFFFFLLLLLRLSQPRVQDPQHNKAAPAAVRGLGPTDAVAGRRVAGRGLPGHGDRWVAADPPPRGGWGLQLPDLPRPVLNIYNIHCVGYFPRRAQSRHDTSLTYITGRGRTIVP